MKTILLALAATVSLAACNNDTTTTAKETSTATADSSKTQSATNNTPAPNSKAPTNDIVTAYLHIKNGLANDNGADAASGGNAFVDALSKVDKSSMSAEQKKSFEDIADDAKEMAEHIGKNADKIDHQREHFDMLSKDMYDMVKSLGAGQTLYQDFCPMYNDKKGATWLSETKDIKNPYMGKKMTDCGTVKEEIK